MRRCSGPADEEQTVLERWLEGFGAVRALHFHVLVLAGAEAAVWDALKLVVVRNDSLAGRDRQAAPAKQLAGQGRSACGQHSSGDGATALVIVWLRLFGVFHEL